METGYKVTNVSSGVSLYLQVYQMYITCTIVRSVSQKNLLYKRRFPWTVPHSNLLPSLILKYISTTSLDAGSTSWGCNSLEHIGHEGSNDNNLVNGFTKAGNRQSGQNVRSDREMWYPEVIQNGNVFLQDMQLTSMTGICSLQKGQGESFFPASSLCCSGLDDLLGPADFLTKFSIFFLIFGSTRSRFSGFISRTAYSIAWLLNDALVHSITVDVRMGIVSGCVSGRDIWGIHMHKSFGKRERENVNHR